VGTNCFDVRLRCTRRTLRGLHEDKRYSHRRGWHRRVISYLTAGQRLTTYLAASAPVAWGLKARGGPKWPKGRARRAQPSRLQAVKAVAQPGPGR
jgi:hypothetical protein